MKSFICAECNEEHPVKHLSHSALVLSGASSRAEAVDNLPAHELVCQACSSAIELEAEQAQDGSFYGRNERERWALSGLSLSKLELDWLYQYQ